MTGTFDTIYLCDIFPYLKDAVLRQKGFPNVDQSVREADVTEVVFNGSAEVGVKGYKVPDITVA